MLRFAAYRLGRALAFSFALTLVIIPQVGRAQDLPAAPGPVLVTSLGQSLDGFQVQLATKRAGAEVVYDPLADASALEGTGTLFLAVGASLKGFGEAGISIDNERDRARAFLAEAKARNIPVVVLHMGGADRRDDLTNQLIEVTAPEADVIFIRSDSDADGKFKAIAESNGIPLVVVPGMVELLPELKRLFSPAS